MTTSFIRALLGALLLSLASLALAGEMLIKTDTLSKQIKDENLVLIDLSDDTQYLRFHLPGAIHLPFEALIVRKNNVTSAVVRLMRCTSPPDNVRDCRSSVR